MWLILLSCRLAFLGFAAQYLATGKGPLENLSDHLANPAEINFSEYLRLACGSSVFQSAAPLAGFDDSLIPGCSNQRRFPPIPLHAAIKSFLTNSSHPC